MRRIKRTLVAAGLAAGLLVTPLLGTSADAATTTIGAKVRIVDFSFMPNTVTITKGQKVVWVNKGTFSHTSTSDTLKWDSGAIAPGARFSVKFNRVGTFTYHCMIHPSMLGSVTVNAVVN
jgi:plastocyanin